MSDEALVSTSEISALLEHATPASTRNWIARHKLEVVARDKHTGEKQYSRADVDRARAQAPGRGFRTDLEPRDVREPD